MFLSSYPVSTTFQSFLLSASFQSFLSKSLYKSTGVALPSLRYRLNTMFTLYCCHTIKLILIYPLKHNSHVFVMIQACCIQNKGSPKSIYSYLMDFKLKKRDNSYKMYHFEILLFIKTYFVDMTQNLEHFD